MKYQVRYVITKYSTYDDWQTKTKLAMFQDVQKAIDRLKLIESKQIGWTWIHTLEIEYKKVG